jgi:hypothetical protein
LLAFYAQIKAVHVAAVLLSGTLFLLRGALVQAGGARWAMSGFARYASYGIDTVLLTAALMLVTILPGRCSRITGSRSSSCCSARTWSWAASPETRLDLAGTHALLRRGACDLRDHARHRARPSPARVAVVLEP